MPVPTPPTFSQASWFAGDDVLNTDWNAAINYLLALGQPIEDDRLSSVPGNLKQRFAALADSFKVSATAIGSTLALSYTGGIIKQAETGIIAIVNAGTLTAPASGVSWVYCLNGAVAITPVQTDPTLDGFLMAKVTATTTAVTTVDDMRSLYREARDYDRRIIIANKSTTTNLTVGGVPLGIPGWSTSRNVGGLLNTSSGEITLTQAMTDIRIDASCLIVCDTPATLTAKLSLYAGSTELKVLAEISSVSSVLANRISLSGWFETNKGESIASGAKLTLQVTLREGGTNSRILADRNTQFMMRWK